MRFLLVGFTFIITSSAALWLTSCGTVFTTTSEPDGVAPPDKPVVGNYYFLPKTRIAIDGTVAGTNYTIAITQVNEPDRRHRYFLRYKGNAFSEDTYTLTVDPKGLLQSLNLQAEDKSPAVINKIADTIVSVVSATANVQGFEAITQTRPDVERPFSVVFDPQDAEEVSKARSVVDAAKFVLMVEPDPQASLHRGKVSNRDKEIVAATRQVSSVEMQNRSSEGIFFHPPTVVTVKIVPKSRDRILLAKLAEIRIPDKHQLAIFDLRRLALVKRTTNLAFVEGNLTSVGETRPSQVLAAVTIPADLAAKAASAIPAIIKIQNETANASTIAETARLKAQTDLLSEETARLKAASALAQQRNGIGATSPVERDVARTALKHAEAENAKAQAELLRTRQQVERQLPNAMPLPSPTESP
jgi:hypothetical protein